MIFNSEYFLDRLLTHAKSTGVASQLIYSNPGTLHYKVYHKNMDKNSFQDIKGIQTMFQQPNTALLMASNVIHRSKEYANCRIEEVFQFSFGPLSMVVSKDSPYKMFIRQAIMDIRDSGTLDNIMKRWSIQMPTCKLDEVDPIFPQKVITGFIGILFGMIISLIMLACEMKFKCRKQNSPILNEKTLERIEEEALELFRRLEYLASIKNNLVFNHTK